MSAFASGSQSTDQLSGLAGEIQRMEESEQFDLAGYTEQRCHDVLVASLSKPLENPTEMIKITFVVGGGKLVRSKYSDDMLKWVTSTLRGIGYTEDKSAAETYDSQGTYKYQHDTGANLKYVIVYPHVACANKPVASDATEKKSSPSTSSPEYLVVTASTATLQEIVAAKVQSWKQKKNCLKVLQDGVEKYRAVETKLFGGQVIDDADQFIYDNNSGCDEEKVTWLQGEIKNMVSKGRLTAAEKQELLQQIQNNLDAEKDSGKQAALTKRKQNVESISPIKYSLKYQDQVVALRVRIHSLTALEQKGRSNSLTMADLKTLEEKPDVLAEIEKYENASRGWFQDDAAFQDMCKAAVDQAASKWEQMVQSKSKKTSSKPKPKPANTWSTVSQPKAKMSRSQAAALTNSRNAFSSAFQDDDSD